jgi:hypothetical protein
MALFSLSHSCIGRKTHRAGTSGAHAAYITRRTAASFVIGQHMPTGYRSARAWLDRQEQDDRANARVIDKVMAALPLELDPEAWADLVREFVRQVGHGRIPWLAVIHAEGKDAHNPHAHIILRDRDVTTGKRVAMLSELHSTERLRAVWERCLNRALEAQGRPERVTRLSLLAQGVERIPERHKGPWQGRQSGVVRTYGFAAANPVRPPSPPSVRAAFVPASLQQCSPKPPAAAPRPRAAAKELLGRAARSSPEPEAPRPAPATKWTPQQQQPPPLAAPARPCLYAGGRKFHFRQG